MNPSLSSIIITVGLLFLVIIAAAKLNGPEVKK